MFYFDRFWEPVENILIGTANVFLQSLAYSLDFADEICIVDYKVSDRNAENLLLPFWYSEIMFCL
jgi:hypothetical protein